MPSPRRKTLRQRADWTKGEHDHLKTGHDFFMNGGGFGNDRRGEFREDDCRTAWTELRDEMLADWIQATPFSRPWAWWKFEAPELRQRADGKIHPFESPERNARNAESVVKHGCPADRAFETNFGKPSIFFMPDDFEARYETERDYLTRLNLLTEHETAISKGQDDPCPTSTFSKP